MSCRFTAACLVVSTAFLPAGAATLVDVSRTLTLSGSFAARGSFVAPAPMSLSASLAAQGSFVTAVPMTVTGSLKARGAFVPDVKRAAGQAATKN